MPCVIIMASGFRMLCPPGCPQSLIANMPIAPTIPIPATITSVNRCYTDAIPKCLPANTQLEYSNRSPGGEDDDGSEIAEGHCSDIVAMWAETGMVLNSIIAERDRDISLLKQGYVSFPVLFLHPGVHRSQKMLLESN